jgi:hypothetical protein
MIENFNDFISLVAIVGIIVAIVIGYFRYQFSSLKENDDDYYQEIL